MSNEIIQLEDAKIAAIVFGERDQHLSQIEKYLDINIHARGTKITISGAPEKCRVAAQVIQQLYEVSRKGLPITSTEVDQALRILKKNPNQNLAEIFLDPIAPSLSKQAVSPKTKTQQAYTEAIRKHDLVFGWGPAGTGKTYLAMAMAVAALTNRDVNRIILTRPAVEAGEKLGFLPGDLAEKVNPYLRPLYDALHDMMEPEKIQRLLDRDVIEVAPLAFMRGRTLSNSFVILDEAQNTTSDQMKMFLTRLGFDSKAVVTGDITQIDLPGGAKSGLVEAIQILKPIEDIGFVEFSDRDVVRHPLVRKIIQAYEAV